MIKVRVYYAGDDRMRSPRVVFYTRVPCIGEIVEAPAPLAPERKSLWEVTRVVHLRRPDSDDGVEATITVRMESEELVERVARRVVELLSAGGAS